MSFLRAFRPGEIVFVVFAAVGIAAIARRRGGRAWLWGVVAGGGYFLIKTAIVRLNMFAETSLQDESLNLARLIVPFGWMAGVVLVARFLIGRGHGAGESWFCPHCQTYNTSDASHCEACGRACQEPEG
ncbi:MAG: hypothetical protein FJY82_06555 [Candidatus Aminicenantes bacterium]|nr:hypothetical protein [Candidatus Aminicenantes bacterium]